MKLAPNETYGWQMKASALALAGLALAGCNSQQDRDNPVTTQPEQTQPVGTDQSSDAPAPPINPSETDACAAIQVPVFPGSRLNQENAVSVQKQLDALVVAKTPKEEVSVRTIFNANAIVTNALIDNLYADSFSSVADLPASDIPDADALLGQIQVSNKQQCLTTDQLQDVNKLYQTLIDGLGPQVGRQLSAAGQVAYDTLRSNYEKFQERYQRELASR